MDMPNKRVAELNYIQQQLFFPGTFKRKLFGVLEKPNVHPATHEASFKVFIWGKQNSGRSLIMNRLIGIDGMKQKVDIVGIHCYFVYWPIKVGGKIALVRLDLWNAGEMSMERYNHVLPACQEGANAILLCFSMTDRSAWNDMSRQLLEVLRTNENADVLIIATRCDEFVNIEVTQQELKALEDKHRVPIIKMGKKSLNDKEEFNAIAPILNMMCRRLWQREYESPKKAKN